MDRFLDIWRCVPCRFLVEKANPETLPKEYHVARKKILFADPATGAGARSGECILVYVCACTTRWMSFANA